MVSSAFHFCWCIGGCWIVGGVLEIEAIRGCTEYSAKSAEKPNFVLLLTQAISGYSPSNNATVVILQAQLWNEGAASAAVAWKAHYTSSTLDSDVKITNFVEDPHVVEIPEQGIDYLIHRSDLVFNRTITPVAKEAPVLAPLPVVIPGNRIAKVAGGNALITIKFADYLDHVYTAQYKGIGQPQRFISFPGANIREHKAKQNSNPCPNGKTAPIEITGVNIHDSGKAGIEYSAPCTPLKVQDSTISHNKESGVVINKPEKATQSDTKQPQ